MRATREEWAKRVERWDDSGLTAAEFSAEMGINPRTLSYWKWRLRKDAGQTTPRPARKRSKGPGPAKAKPKGPTFVEVTPPPSTWWQAAQRIEVVVDERLVVRVPEEFEPRTLRLVVKALSGADDE